MQLRKLRTGICAANLNDVMSWEYNDNAAQKAIAQKPRLISALEFASLRQQKLIVRISAQVGARVRISTLVGEDIIILIYRDKLINHLSNKSAI